MRKFLFISQVKFCSSSGRFCFPLLSPFSTQYSINHILSFTFYHASDQPAVWGGKGEKKGTVHHVNCGLLLLRCLVAAKDCGYYLEVVVLSRALMSFDQEETSLCSGAAMKPAPEALEIYVCTVIHFLTMSRVLIGQKSFLFYFSFFYVLSQECDARMTL